MKFLLNFLLKGMPFYSVARGRTTGVYLTWEECEKQVKGFKAPIFRKFGTYDEATNFVLVKGGTLEHDVKQDAASKNPSDNKIVQNKRKLVSDESISKVATAVRIDNLHLTKKLKKNDNTEVPIKRLQKYGDLSFQEDDDGYVHVFTDGSCEGNGTAKAVAGLGVYFGEGHALNIAKPVSGRATNNCGEIQAATLAVQLAGDNGIQKLCINTDSQFLINAVTKWMKGWKRNGWRIKTGEPVKNVSDFKKYEEITSKYKTIIKWNYVKAHCGILGNERADALAKQGGEMYRSQLKT